MNINFIEINKDNFASVIECAVFIIIKATCLTKNIVLNKTC